MGIIFLVVSMVIKYNVELRRSICTEQVSAVIAGVTKHNIYDSDGPDTEIYTPVLYNPTENSRQVAVAFRTVAIILLAVTVILALFK